MVLLSISAFFAVFAVGVAAETTADLVGLHDLSAALTCVLSVPVVVGFA